MQYVGVFELTHKLISFTFVNFSDVFSLRLFQTRPVPFTVQAVVTTSDMEFNVTNLDFGYCTIYESVKTTIKLSNRSILPQEYGFVGLPDVSTCICVYH